MLAGRLHLTLLAPLLLVPIVGCAGSDDGDSPVRRADRELTAPASDASPPAASSEADARVFTEDDLDSFERGLRKEIEAIRTARKNSMEATTPEERGNAIQASFEDATTAQGAAAAGLPLERYRAIREAVMKTFRTLDFQGRIEGPMQMDMSRASAEQKEALARDPFEALPAASATALRARMDRLVPLWLEYIELTAVAG